jgi:hypothetical protein
MHAYLLIAALADINDVAWQLMYKRTKGLSKSKPRARTVQDDAVDRVLELMDAGAPPMSLVVSPKTRVAELKSIFSAEYPQLDFAACDAVRQESGQAGEASSAAPPASRACTATPARS